MEPRMGLDDLDRAEISALQGRMSSFKLRCPECFKLYVVKASDIREPRPRFECLSCKTQFWIPFDESLDSQEILGFPLAWLEENEEKAQAGTEKQLDQKPPQEQVSAEFHCPKCESPYAVGETECRQCGLIFAKFDWVNSQGTADHLASAELKFLWHQAKMDYEDKSAHQKFLAACQKEDNLVYAAAQYGRILEAEPGDPMAQSMSQAVQALTSFPLEREGLLGRASGAKASAARPRGSWPWPRLSSWIILVSSMLIVVGYFLPALRNMVGVGAALIFLSIALRMYFPRL